MGTKQVRITDEAVEIVRKYTSGDSITRGIIEMEKRITTSNLPGTTSNGTTSNFSLLSVTQEEWALFEAHVRKAVNKQEVKLDEKKPDKETGFYTANTKIDGCEIKSAVVNGVKHEFIMHPTKGRLWVW